MRADIKQILENQKVIMDTLSFLLSREIGREIGECSVRGIATDPNQIEEYGKKLTALHAQIKTSKIQRSLI